MKRDEAESAIGELYIKNDREMERVKQVRSTSINLASAA